jgi:pimeloyl-ACP methyl ester carboxylesterase
MFGEDLVILIDALDLDAITAVGHSMGGHSVVHAAALRPLAFRSLLLLDPVIRESGKYGKPWMEDHFARKRRNQWASPEEMYERFRAREPFHSWDQQTLRDYCQYALKEGGVLACAPEFEASVYEHSSDLDADLDGELGAIAVPVTVMRAHLEWNDDNGMSGSPTDPKLAARFQRGIDVQVPFGHFFPMEAPDLVIEQILSQVV